MTNPNPLGLTPAQLRMLEAVQRLKGLSRKGRRWVEPRYLFAPKLHDQRTVDGLIGLGLLAREDDRISVTAEGARVADLYYKAKP